MTDATRPWFCQKCGEWTKLPFQMDNRRQVHDPVCPRGGMLR